MSGDSAGMSGTARSGGTYRPTLVIVSGPPGLRVATAKGYDPGLDAVIDFIRA